MNDDTNEPSFCLSLPVPFQLIIFWIYCKLKVLPQIQWHSEFMLIEIVSKQIN